MKSIERRFKRIETANPGLSSYQYFKWAISGQNFSAQTISREFNRLVEKNDYDKFIKKALLAELKAISKCVEDNKK